MSTIPSMDAQDITDSSHLGIVEVGQERNGASVWIFLQGVEGSQEKEGGQGGPVLGATAGGEGVKEELRDEVPSGSAALEDGRNHGGGSSSNSQQEEPIPGSTKGYQALPRPAGQRNHVRHRFTAFQLQELERIFERNHYPSAEARIGLKAGEPNTGNT
ncbi:homeobox protein orthopedia-like isoform X1 [Mesocricetus auratus]|uniref:Homeobox protein orthopedia-like isoform X1 n=1 Tax=Mesocricetus auratus TaxID=10036 RepID=A0ABM2XE64_MESAU|nr:homeobox protein orthopedia-like isoform X1 [Mesocricetus auratus]